MKRNILLAVVVLIGIVLFAYGVLGLFNEEYTLSNYALVAGIFIAFISLIYNFFDGEQKAKDKKEDVCRALSVEYGKHRQVKDFINDNLDRNGDLLSRHILRNQPTKAQVEDFMRFFKNLNWEIQCGNISWETAKKKFSKYALIVHRYEFFRSSIDDYNSPNWQDFRDYCEHILKMK